MMLAKLEILDLWQQAISKGVAAAFFLTYGETTGAQRYNETADAFSREDDVRIIKSIIDLCNDAPDSMLPSSWGAWQEMQSIVFHEFDDDYPSRKRVPTADRDPNINMYSEALAPEDDIQEGGEDAPDMSFDDLEQDEDMSGSGNPEYDPRYRD